MPYAFGNLHAVMNSVAQTPISPNVLITRNPAASAGEATKQIPLSPVTSPSNLPTTKTTTPQVFPNVPVVTTTTKAISPTAANSSTLPVVTTTTKPAPVTAGDVFTTGGSAFDTERYAGEVLGTPSCPPPAPCPPQRTVDCPPCGPCNDVDCPVPPPCPSCNCPECVCQDCETGEMVTQSEGTSTGFAWYYVAGALVLGAGIGWLAKGKMGK